MEPRFVVVYTDEASDFIEALVIATHGFQKKTQKTPPKEIAKAESIRRQYFEDKENINNKTMINQV